jgi:hypothetical protein
MKLIKEPLLHFLLIGALLFVVYQQLNPESPSRPDEILVSAGRIESLAATFTRTWQRPPTAEELKGLVDAYVREEMLAREAMKLSLDRNDPVIRRRLEQKMEFIIGDIGSSTSPTDEQLAAFLTEHPDSFRRPASYTFRQVFLSSDKRGDAVITEANRLLEQLRKDDSSFGELGDPSLLPREVAGESATRITSTFGEDFTKALDKLTLHQWSEPVVSGFGVHLVRLDERVDGRLPNLDEIRSQVAREWSQQLRQRTRDQYLQSLLDRYQVTVEWPESGAAS